MKLFAIATLVALLVAGCAAKPVENDDDATTTPPPAPTHVLAGTVEPTAMIAPTFRLLGSLARGGPAYGAGEPGIWAGLDGSLLVSFPGCDRGFYLVEIPGQEQCGHGLVYRSADDGATWKRLNQDGTGLYNDGGEGPAANGDADVALDSAGTIYVSNLGSGIQVHSSKDNGTTWAYLGNVVQEGEFADRQWMAAAGPGHLVMTWMGSGKDVNSDDQGRAVIVNTTFDGGATWTGSLALGSGIGWLGPVQFATDGMTAYIPFTQPTGGAAVVVLGGQDFEMKVARTLDGGRNWTVLDTGMKWPTTMTGGHWSGGHMAPALDVTGDGTVVAAMSIDYPVAGVDAATATNQGTIIVATYSRDGGATWSDMDDIAGLGVIQVGPTEQLGSAIMPWITGGAGDRFAISYLFTPSPVDNDYGGALWDVRAAIVDGAASGNLVATDALVEANVHQGGICTRGGLCLLTGSDRALLDYFEADILPDGRLAVVYPADPLTGGKYIDIRVAIQDGGTFLLERPAPQS